MVTNLFRQRAKDQRGYTMVLTLGVVLVLLIVGMALLALVENEATRLIRYRDSQEAYFLAEAGVNRALWNIDLGRRTDATVGSEASPVSLGRGGYWTTYDTAAKVLTSTGQVSGVTRTITVRVNDVVTPSAFDTAVFAAQFNAIPDDVTVWNDCDIAEPDPNKVVVVNYGTSALTIQGYVKNKPYSSVDDLGYAYCAKGITPTSNKNVHWKEATEDPGYEWVVFNRSDYQSAIIAADKDGDENTEGDYIWESNYDLTPGSSYPGASWDDTNHRWLVDGNLTIRNYTITSSSATLSAPAEVVVYGTVTIQDATIGASDTSNYIHITAGGQEDYKPAHNANDYSSSRPKLNSSNPIMTIQGTDPANNKRVYIYKEVQLYSNGKTDIYNAVNMSQASIYSLGEIHVESNQPGVKLTLRGDVFSKEKITFTTTGSGVGIEIEGSCIAGCKSPDPSSPGDLITYTGQIQFGEVSKSIDLIFNRGAKAESGPGGAFQVSAGATLDYSTWRER